MTIPISAAALAAIERFEIGSRASFNGRLSWPGGASGITAGIGHDLGYTTQARIAQDWGAWLPPATVARMQACAGLTGSVARLKLRQVVDIVIPWAAAVSVFESCDIPRTADLTAATFPNCDQLSPDSFGALVSLVFNRGASMADSQPGNRLEMRQIRDAMAAGRFVDVPGRIRAMKRLWQGVGLDGLLVRRDAEADLFAAGLAGTAPAAPPAPPESDADRLNDAQLASLKGT